MAISFIEREDDIVKPANLRRTVVVWRKDLGIYVVEILISDALAYTEVYDDPTEENKSDIWHAVKD